MQTDYALRVLMYVVLRDGALVKMGDIASDYGISHNHLTKVVHRLATLGYLRTVQGRHGGMCLAKPAEKIRVGDVVRDFEPDFFLVECLEKTTSHCRIQQVCVLQDVLHDAIEDFMSRLDQVTLATLVRPSRKLQKLLDLPIKRIAVDVQAPV